VSSSFTRASGHLEHGCCQAVIAGTWGARMIYEGGLAPMYLSSGPSSRVDGPGYYANMGGLFNPSYRVLRSPIERSECSDDATKSYVVSTTPRASARSFTFADPTITYGGAAADACFGRSCS
jgi:hypothetical protein